MSVKISFIPLERALKQSDLVQLDFLRAAKEGQINLYYGKYADAAEKIDFSKRRYTEKGDSLIIGSLDDDLAGCIDDGSKNAIEPVGFIADIVETDYLSDEAAIKKLWITQSDFDYMKQSTNDAATAEDAGKVAVSGKQVDSVNGNKDTVAEIELTIKVYMAYESLKEKGEKISARSLEAETERMFHNRVGKDVCLKVSRKIDNVITDMKEF